MAHLHSPFSGPLDFRKQVKISYSSYPFSFTAVQTRGSGRYKAHPRGGLPRVLRATPLQICRTTDIRSSGQPVDLVDGDNAFANGTQFHKVIEELENPAENLVSLASHVLMVAELLFESATKAGLHLF